MPFTLSHPAAILLSVRGRLPLSALVVGSMAPDFPYYLPLPIDSKFGHTPLGTVVFCLPCGLLALWLFHGVLKLPLWSLFPLRHQQKLASVAASWRFGSADERALVITALFVGVCTHIIWDGLVHGIESLGIGYGADNRLGYFLMLVQIANSVIGAVVLAWWSVRWLQRAPLSVLVTPPMWSDTMRRALISLLLLIPLIAGIVLAYANWDKGWAHLLDRDVLAREMKVAVIELLIYSLGWHWRNRKLSR